MPRNHYSREMDALRREKHEDGERRPRRPLYMTVGASRMPLSDDPRVNVGFEDKWEGGRLMLDTMVGWRAQEYSADRRGNRLPKTICRMSGTFHHADEALSGGASSAYVFVRGADGLYRPAWSRDAAHVFAMKDATCWMNLRKMVSLNVGSGSVNPS